MAPLIAEAEKLTVMVLVLEPALIKKAKSLLTDQSSLNIIATMNAGFIPSNVWVHDLNLGGGRIIGEACHFMDLGVFLTGSLIESVSMSSLGNNYDASKHFSNACGKALFQSLQVHGRKGYS